jgi:hypothetical protein
MADTTTSSPFRLQVCRLAWLMTFSLFAVVVLMWVMGHAANGILADVGLGLFFGASLFSALARRFGPFAWALFGLLILSLSLCA